MESTETTEPSQPTFMPLPALVAKVEHLYLAFATSEPLASRFVQPPGALQPVRQKFYTSTERINKIDDHFVLCPDKKGAERLPIVPIEQMVQLIYVEWMKAKEKKSTVEIFTREFGNKYAGTRQEDIKFIIRAIKRCSNEK